MRSRGLSPLSLSMISLLSIIILLLSLFHFSIPVSLFMPVNQAQVMWPRLVANKILRKGLGSNNFVTDVPSTNESILEIPSLDEEPSLSHDTTIFDHDHKETKNYK
ncbi:hypothetical protein Ddye_030428 [Dipteronia dyeriana]|uniref:Uncharacterized protein n=1 Tax=Dipteronia dyeriana TaxID=168575 RepID=A0AAD9TGN9_9ROSI|nr:hypothetical protein Ddye_030428 [Dipteronia dyeriana]